MFFGVNSLQSAFRLVNGLVFVLAVVMMWYVITFLSKTLEANSEYRSYGEPVSYSCQVIKSDGLEIISLMGFHALVHDEAKVKIVRERMNSTGAQVQLLKQKLGEGLAPEFKEEVEGLERSYATLVSKMEAQYEKPNVEQILLDVTPQINQMAFHINRMGDLNWKLYGAKREGLFRDFEGFRIRFGVILLAFFLSIFLVLFVLHKGIMRLINSIQNHIQILTRGDLPQAFKKASHELNPILMTFNDLIVNLSAVKAFAIEVGKRNFSAPIQVFGDQGELGQALVGMRDSLKKVEAEELQRKWHVEGIAQFEVLLRKQEGDLQQLTDQFLSHLCFFLEASQGTLYGLEQENGPVLKRWSTFAFDRKKFLEGEVFPGHGIVGQCYLDQEAIYLTDVPSDFVQITSGLGGAKPTNVYVAPLIFNEQVIGVLELASFKDIGQEHQAFISRVGESLAATIFNEKNSLDRKQLLEESQRLTNSLRAQEEELRQNTEELLATQEEMGRRIANLENELEQAGKKLPDVSGILIDEQG
ncbi:GAF domain-containing protein [Persicobacter diffluens]|uniref:GAF domain-containing protein n=1 Tax=Persicobacter diffluens TaxID=981 RepID=A0AAN4W057_9BACT|nr:hypothetical protein PEDI_38360 [Persicobacter diffluens]